MSRKWRIGIVKDTSKRMLGSHALHTAFHGLPNVEVVALVDSNTDELDRKMSACRATNHYPTIEAMLAAGPPDIAVLCSRHPADHLPQIRQLAPTCHIYCEKPLAVSLEEADEIVAVAARHGITIGMAHPCRYAPGYRTMKRLIAEGVIGTPTTIYGRGKNDHRGGGEDLIVLGTHILDVQTWLCGAPEAVFASVTVDGRPITRADRAETVEPIGPVAGDRIFAHFRLPNNVRGIFESQRGLGRQPEGIAQMGIAVTGSEGTISLRFDDAAARPLRLSRMPCPPEAGEAFEEIPITVDRDVPGAEPLDYNLCGQRDVPGAPLFIEAGRYAVWDLMRAIEEGRRPIASVHDARLVVEMIYGIYASSLAGREVALPLTNREHPLGS